MSTETGIKSETSSNFKNRTPIAWIAFCALILKHTLAYFGIYAEHTEEIDYALTAIILTYMGGATVEHIRKKG